MKDQLPITTHACYILTLVNKRAVCLDAAAQDQMTEPVPAEVPTIVNEDFMSIVTELPPADRVMTPADILPSLPVRVFDPISSSGTIGALQPRTEFELQAWLFNRLKLDGFDVRGEIRGRTEPARMPALIWSFPLAIV